MNTRLFTRTVCFLLTLVMLLGMIPDPAFAAEESAATEVSASNEWDTDGDGILEILAIGNSFSTDALQYAYQIAADLGIEEIAIGNLYYAGCTLDTHVLYATGDQAQYTYYFNDSGSWKSTKNYTAHAALTSRSWDYVSLQQGSPLSGVESSYGSDLEKLIAYVRERSDAKLVWHMTWAYQQDATHSAFPNYDNDQMTMYNAIVSAVQNKILTNDNFDLVVPNATAVQNSRTSLLGDTTTRDGYHMSYSFGRYLTGLMFMKAVTGYDLDSVRYAPEKVTAEQKAIAIESVNNAYAEPFAVTQSSFSGKTPGDDYLELKPELTRHGYWYSTHADNYNTIVTTADNSSKFFATVRFTRESLPVGSIIMLADGWQYRPEGWVTDTVQTSRQSNVTSSYAIVTEEWWADYTIRAFNISKIGTPNLSDVTEDDIRAAFRIYVPAESHVHQFGSGNVCVYCGFEQEGTHNHTYENGTCTGCGEPHPGLDIFEGKTLSILGDSISTYKNWSNGTAAQTTNSTITNGTIYYPKSGFSVTAEDTWWYQAAEMLGLELLVNNSWSGSCLLNSRSGAPGAYLDRCVQLHDDTGDNAGQKPDVIAIFLGTNDYYTYASTLGSYESIDFDTLIAESDEGFTYAAPATSMEAYAIVLHKIGVAYPDAEVYCFTMLPRVNSTSQPTAFNEDIRQLADRFGAAIVDLYDCGISSETTAFNMMMGDNLHPDCAGMDAMTNAFVSALLKNSGMQTYDVSFELNDVLAMEGTARTVPSGGELVVTLSPLDASKPLDVTVTMGGEDITEGCYDSGVVTIPAVTADVTISAEPGVRAPLNFRWETRNNALVSIDTDGFTANPVTRTAGTVSGSSFSSAQFTMNQAISLRHDLPWQVEWKSSGTWVGRSGGSGVLLFAEGSSSSTKNASYLYRRPNTDFIGLGYYDGTYRNYGVVLSGRGLDLSQEHIYRMENRIAEDGSNMVWLLIDGVEMGPLVQYYEGGTNKNTTSNWVSGKDFAFRYMGTSSHPLGSCSIEYIQIWENGEPHKHTYTAAVTAPTCAEQGYTTYTCACGESYVDDYEDATGEHTYENGICTGCGAAQPGGIVITRQPVSADAAIGKTATLRVEAQGEDLSYQWYYRDAGDTEFTKSTVRKATYSLTVKAANAARELYCVITDSRGNRAVTDTVKLLAPLAQELAIIRQPQPAHAAMGETATVTMEVQGVGLSYQWYYRDLPGGSLTKSTITSKNYSLTVKPINVNRELYCVITDAHGNKVTTDTVKLLAPLAQELAILRQPASDDAVIGEVATISVEAQGEGLSYQWYFRESPTGSLSKSSITGSTYAVTVTKSNLNRELYCVITDSLGNQVRTETVRLVQPLAEALEITRQPVSAYAAIGEVASVTVEASGEGLSYQWYFRNTPDGALSRSSITGNTYSVTVTNSNAQRVVYCVVTDGHGNQVTTDTVALRTDVVLPVYYPTLSDALAGTNGTSSPEGAVAQADNTSGETVITLLRDTVLTASLVVSADGVLDLNGHTVSAAVSPMIRVTSGACTLRNGSIILSGDGTGTEKAPTVAITVASGASLETSNAIITVTDPANGTVNGILSEAGSMLMLTETDITVTTGNSLGNIGVYANGDAVLRNCSVIAEADYTGASGKYTSYSKGIVSKAALELYDCYVWGAHCGVATLGSVYVDGGTYAGYGHGAFYLSGAGSTNCIYNATIKWATMRSGTVADSVAGTNNSAMYIGSASNITTYFDGCTFSANHSTNKSYCIVLRNSGGETNNSVYVSNSSFKNYNKYAYRTNDVPVERKLFAYSGVGNTYSTTRVFQYTRNGFYTNESYAHMGPAFSLYNP